MTMRNKTMKFSNEGKCEKTEAIRLHNGRSDSSIAGTVVKQTLIQQIKEKISRISRAAGCVVLKKRII
jgi:hypothetical protein